MCFGTDPGITSRIQWYWCEEGALDLPFPTPFCSRVQDRGMVELDIGEVNWEKRAWRDGTFPIELNGLTFPCGPEEIWRNGYNGGSPPGLPRNMFGLSECCGGLQAFPGDPTFGLLAGVTPIRPLPILRPVEAMAISTATFQASVPPFPIMLTGIIVAPPLFVLRRPNPVIPPEEFPVSRLLFGSMGSCQENSEQLSRTSP